MKTVILLQLFLLLWVKSQASQAPNIVFVLADDLGWGDVSFHGSEIKTPVIDQMAKEGVILNNYYVQPMCTPTRGALMTGKYPIHTGLQHMVITGADPYGLPLSEKTLAQHLKHLGYSTHIVGKWHLGFFANDYLPLNRGFDSHLGTYLGFGDYFTHEVYADGFTGYDFHEDDTVRWGFDNVYATEIFTDRAEDIIRSHNKSQPLFLMVAHQAVHTGNEDNETNLLQVPQEYVDRYSYIKDPKRRKFAGMMAALDDSLGQISTALEEAGLMNNTLIIFSTDNGGPANGMGGSMASNWPLRGSKETVWQGGVRGTAFIYSKLLKKQGYVNQNLMHVVDWLPTFYNLAGGDVTDIGDIDGIDQLNVLFENATTSRTEVLVNIDPVDNNEALIMGHYKLVVGDVSKGQYDGWYPPPDFNSTSDIHGSSGKCDKKVSRHEVTVNCGQKPDNDVVSCRPEEAACLFNLKDDPCEYDNLADKQPDVVAQLQARLNYFRSSMIAPGNKPVDPSGNPQLHGGVWQPWL